MKIAIISDTHFGYARFEEDAFVQAENAIIDANSKADFIILAGDIFDTKIPKLETLKRAAEIISKSKIPIIAIHGNHERRSRGMVNPVQLLDSLGVLTYLHGTEKIFEKNGVKVFVLGIGSVPEELASEALKKVLESKNIPSDCFKVIVIHQSIRELTVGGEHELSLDELESTGFDLIINGHIHERMEKLGGKFLIPGSTVVTQLKKEESRERGYLIYDVATRTNQFVVIKHRKFFYDELYFDETNELSKIKEVIDLKIFELRNLDKEAIIRLKIKGKLRDGLKTSDLNLGRYDDLVFLDNQINGSEIKEKIEQLRKIKDEKLSVRDIALRTIDEQLRGKVHLIKPSEFFEKLVESTESGEDYINQLS